jgi:hypothetical protein
MLVMYGANIITPISFEIHCYRVDINSFLSKRNNSQIQNDKWVLSSASSLKFFRYISNTDFFSQSIRLYADGFRKPQGTNFRTYKVELNYNALLTSVGK